MLAFVQCEWTVVLDPWPYLAVYHMYVSYQYHYNLHHNRENLGVFYCYFKIFDVEKIEEEAQDLSIYNELRNCESVNMSMSSILPSRSEVVSICELLLNTVVNYERFCTHNVVRLVFHMQRVNVANPLQWHANSRLAWRSFRGISPCLRCMSTFGSCGIMICYKSEKVHTSTKVIIFNRRGKLSKNSFGRETGPSEGKCLISIGCGRVMFSLMYSVSIEIIMPLANLGEWLQNQLTWIEFHLPILLLITSYNQN